MAERGEAVRPEIAADGLPARRSRWVELATSADHKDTGRMLIGSAAGFLFIAGVLLVLMRLQLAIPENGFLDPVTFNRLLSVYGATALFCFALPLVFGLFLYLVPLQVGARSTVLPRLSRTGVWLCLAGAAVLYASFAYTPPEAGINPLPPLSEPEFLASSGVEVWLTTAGLVLLGLILISIDLVATLRIARAPGMAWRRMPVLSWAGGTCAWLMLVTGTVMLAAVTMLMIDRQAGGGFFDGGAGGAPLLWQHLSWIFLAGAWATILIAALGAAAEIVQDLSRRALEGRGTVIGSLVALGVLVPLAWTQNMTGAPIGSGWHHFGMIMGLATVIPLGLILFNLMATLAGGAIEVRASLLFAAGALSLISIGLAIELLHTLTAAGALISGTVAATAATHYVLAGGAVLGGFAALHHWYPKMSGRVLGESMGAISFWLMLAGANVAFLPLLFAGLNGQVAGAYKYFDGAGLAGWNLVSTLGALILFAGIVLGLANLVASIGGGRPARHDQWGGSTLEWYTLSPPPPHNFDVVPDVRSPWPLLDIREALAERERLRREGGAGGAEAGAGEPAPGGEQRPDPPTRTQPVA